MKNELPSLTATAGNSHQGLAIGFTVTTVAFALGGIYLPVHPFRRHLISIAEMARS
ncbi:MAG: hypothetical protein ACLPYZ_17730 [Limisphaerales bacterium]